MIGLFQPLIRLVEDNLLNILQMKNYIEVIMVPLSIFSWIYGWCAPVLGIILVQLVRIKYLGSNFTK